MRQKVGTEPASVTRYFNLLDIYRISCDALRFDCTTANLTIFFDLNDLTIYILRVCRLFYFKLLVCYYIAIRCVIFAFLSRAFEINAMTDADTIRYR